jgi:hypothetical protein
VAVKATRETALPPEATLGSAPPEQLLTVFQRQHASYGFAARLGENANASYLPAIPNRRGEEAQFRPSSLTRGHKISQLPS